jgi:hypothetical protein
LFQLLEFGLQRLKVVLEAGRFAFSESGESRKASRPWTKAGS